MLLNARIRKPPTPYTQENECYWNNLLWVFSLESILNSWFWEISWKLPFTALRNHNTGRQSLFLNSSNASFPSPYISRWDKKQIYVIETQVYVIWLRALSFAGLFIERLDLKWLWKKSKMTRCSEWQIVGMVWWLVLVRWLKMCLPLNPYKIDLHRDSLFPSRAW